MFTIHSLTKSFLEKGSTKVIYDRLHQTFSIGELGESPKLFLKRFHVDTKARPLIKFKCPNKLQSTQIINIRGIAEIYNNIDINQVIATS